jgi:hypothetical protein
VALLLAAALPSLAAGFDHSVWDRVLKARVSEWGEVDYAALQANPADLEAYVGMLGEASPESHPDRFTSRDSRLAYWLNAYNAFTVAGVVKGYPVKSIRDLGMLWGFLRKKAYVAGGQRLSLNHIEHKILRKRFTDARIHFAIVCASVSCPRLAREAFVPERVDEQLEALARRFINEPRHVTIDPEANRLTLNKIFDWFEEDFEAAVSAGGPPKIVAYLVRYSDPERRKQLEGLRKPKIKYHRYDWGLNAPGALPKPEVER